MTLELATFTSLIYTYVYFHNVQMLKAFYTIMDNF